MGHGNDVFGTLLGRCVQAVGGKPFDIGRNGREFIAEANWMTKRLCIALAAETRNDEAAWALIDSGGPHWTRVHSQFTRLDEADQASILERLPRFTLTVAESIVKEAANESWSSLATEAWDIIAWLDGEKVSRTDFLVKRLERCPLVLDLKYRSDVDRAKVASLHEDVYKRYAHPLAVELGRPVAAQVFTIDRHQIVRWSKPEDAYPRRKSVSSQN